MKGFHSIFVLQQLASISNNVAAQVECALVIKVRIHMILVICGWIRLWMVPSVQCAEVRVLADGLPQDLYETFHDDSQHLTVFEGIIMFACIQVKSQDKVANDHA